MIVFQAKAAAVLWAKLSDYFDDFLHHHKPHHHHHPPPPPPPPQPIAVPVHVPMHMPMMPQMGMGMYSTGMRRHQHFMADFLAQASSLDSFEDWHSHSFDFDL